MLNRFTDTLAKRLFLMMWAALVVSHLMAYAAFVFLHGESKGFPSVGNMPTFPSLPPTPGIPDTGRRGGGGGGDTPGARGGPRDEPGTRGERGERGGSPPPWQGPAAQHDPGRDRSAPPPGRAVDGGVESGPGAMGERPGRGPPPLPYDALILDYGIRLLVIALAAWLGSRWVVSPVKQLVQAFSRLGETAGRDEALPVLDDRRGAREVREAASVFNVMARRLRQQFTERGLFVAALSHDLRTPLTRLRMRLEAMDEAPELQQKSVADIREMNALIDTVLDLFRSGANAAEPVQNTDVTALVQAIADDMAEQGLSVECRGDPVVMATRPVALRRVVGNLIGNAVRYGGNADVAVTPDGPFVRITIDDSGPGIPPPQLEAVFQPFYRLESSRNRDTGGAGLGLYIARDLLEREGGKLTLANRLEGGLRAEIRLPIRSAS